MLARRYKALDNQSVKDTSVTFFHRTSNTVISTYQRHVLRITLPFNFSPFLLQGYETAIRLLV